MAERRRVPTVCPYCGVGCGLYLVIEDRRVVGIDYQADHPVNRGALCPKGNAALDVVYHPDRLRYPMKRDGNKWQRISWDEALDLVASQFGAIMDRHGPDAVGFLASAKCTNEENYLLAKLARLCGTNNVDHCARL